MLAASNRLSSTGRTLDEMLGMDDVEDAVPCPACGSRVTMLTLLVPGEWQCWERACSAIWTVPRE